MTKKAQLATSLFDAALPQIESASIRAWAEGQRAIWLEIIESWCAKHAHKSADADTVSRVTTIILCEAIGL